MPTVLAVTSAIQVALGIIGAFKGNAQVAKVTGQVQDAISVVTALTPIVQSFAGGKEYTLEDVRATLAGADAVLSAFDAEIARQGG